MTIPFIIRDDDLSYFTDMSQLYDLYSDVWFEYPITFAVVPWQKGAFAGHVPVELWHSDRKYAIGDNQTLVVGIKDEIKAGNADIALHGICHTYSIRRNRITPELYEYEGEFSRDLDLARSYLETLFDIDINTFVPPSNTMRKDISRVLIDEGWNLLNLPGVWRNTRPLLSLKHQYGRLHRIYNHLRYGVDSTKPLVWRDRWEVGGFALTPNTRLDSLKRAFELAKDRGHPFVLATHHWEHMSLVPGGDGLRQYDLLREFLDYVSKYDVKPVRARDLKL